MPLGRRAAFQRPPLSISEPSLRGWPVVYYLPVSVAGNIQVLCEERSNSRCSSQVRGRTSGVRQSILDCVSSAPFGTTVMSDSNGSARTLASSASAAEASTAITTVRALAAVRNPRFRHRDAFGIARLNPGRRRCFCHRHSQSWVPRPKPVGLEPDLQREKGRGSPHYQ